MRPRSRHAGGAGRSADPRARHGGRGRTFDARAGEDDRTARQILRDARQGGSGAPVYGEHTREVLREHGFDQAQIDAFEREGAIVAAAAGRKEQVA